jgi:carboxyl-terminal processing protease
MEWMARGAVLTIALWGVAGCGGGGGNGPVGSAPNNPFRPGVFQPSSSYANQCAAPRSGTSDRTGSTFTENMFLRSWTNELYLWYSEVPDRDPTGVSTANYFDALKTPAMTASGRAKDQFHFTYSTAEWEQLSQSGIELGYGAEWVITSSTTSRTALVAYVEPGFAAANANLARGAEVLLADGVDVRTGGGSSAIAVLNEAFFPTRTGPHTFQIRETSGVVRNITMNAASVTHKPVLISDTIDAGGVPVGYMLFNDHIATAEAQLVSAITSMRSAGVQDLILDLRYNGGGLLDIASELGYMIAGNRTVGQTFERLVFNDKNPTTNPVTGQALAPTPFHTTARGFSLAAGTQLPTLNLNRVYVITSNNTCSASESIINSLRGVGVAVYQIGSTTCGKPYGFYPEDNCGTTYFSIQFEGRNAQGIGNYPDGFTPENSPNLASYDLPGCSVADDFTRALGDELEGRLRVALAYRASNNSSAACPAATGFSPEGGFSSKTTLPAEEGEMHKSPARMNRILSQ